MTSLPIWRERRKHDDTVNMSLSSHGQFVLVLTWSTYPCPDMVHLSLSRYGQIVLVLSWSICPCPDMVNLSLSRHGAFVLLYPEEKTCELDNRVSCPVTGGTVSYHHPCIPYSTILYVFRISPIAQFFCEFRLVQFICEDLSFATIFRQDLPVVV